MQSKPEHLYEYAVVRFVPRVEREEFINIGLIMMCKRRRWIRVSFADDFSRLRLFAPSPISEDLLREHMRAFERMALGGASCGEMSSWPVEERFRWLSAVKSACIQTSRPHPGLTGDLDATFERLFAELVL